MRIFIAAALALLLSACGGGGGGDPTPAPTLPPIATPTPTPQPTPTPAPPAPGVALFFVSGHGFPPRSYLNETGGPDLTSFLESIGYMVEPRYYIDGAYPAGGFGGYVSLTEDLRLTDRFDVPRGTRIVMVAHSHGSVWANAAAYNAPGILIDCTVLLDASSFEWSSTHSGETGFIGFDPVEHFDVGVYVEWPQYPLPSEATGTYDLEDIAPANVRRMLEVRSGAYPPAGSERYDEKWNIRETGTVDGIEPFFSDSTHTDVHQVGSDTLAIVKAWLIDPNGCGL